MNKEIEPLRSRVIRATLLFLIIVSGANTILETKPAYAAKNLDATIRELRKEQKKGQDLEKENTKLKIQLETALKQVQIEKEKAEKLTEEIEKLKKQASLLTETYIVKKNDSLWKIAGKPEVYQDPYKWLIIYHANRDQIYDPNLIYPNMILLVPRLPGTEKEE